MATQPTQRRVFVVAVPVKDIGRIRRAFIKLVTLATGSPMMFAMHWAIQVDNSYFELHRLRGLAKPRLRVSSWPQEKRKEIITTVPVGWTSLGDEEVVLAGALSFIWVWIRKSSRLPPRLLQPVW